MILGSDNLQCVLVYTSMLTHPATSNTLLTIANGITWLTNKSSKQTWIYFKISFKRDTNYMYVRWQFFFPNSLPEKFERGLTFNHTQSYINSAYAFCGEEGSSHIQVNIMNMKLPLFMPWWHFYWWRQSVAYSLHQIHYLSSR